MASCSERASSLPSTFQGQTWFRHKHAVSTLRVTSSGSMYLKTPQGYRTRMDLSQPGRPTKTTDRSGQLAYQSMTSWSMPGLQCRDGGVLELSKDAGTTEARRIDARGNIPLTCPRSSRNQPCRDRRPAPRRSRKPASPVSQSKSTRLHSSAFSKNDFELNSST